ncbi:MAG TPA: GGDEF domain-containing protein [Acidobacteriaceae bacterium]|nr:GGDEF domain-containing protein [Acidobacteriaceae bacterium]
MAVLVPLRSLVFGAVFFGLWWWQRRLRYLLYLSVSFTLFTVGTCAQTAGIPRDIAWNFMLSAMVYTGAVIALLNGCYKRVNLRPRVARLWIAGLVLLGIAYFCFADPNLKARIYVMNFGLGALTLIDAVYLGRAAKKPIDRMVFGVVLVLGIQGFPRTLLSFGTTGQSRDMMAFAHSSYWQWMNATYAVLVLVVGLTFVTAVVVDVIEELRGRAMEDPLTGLLNRRGFEEAARRQIARAKGTCFSVAVCDIDHFKAINDSCGHMDGDAVLVKVAELLRENLRRGDEMARFGGEEFVMLLSDIHREDARDLIERLRLAIEATRFGSGSLRQRRITASFGIAEYRVGEDLADAIRRADKLLYAAKRNGRNNALVDWLRIELQVETVAKGAAVN